MRLEVHLFARARDLAGTGTLIVELPDGATVADLRRRLAADCRALHGLLDHSAIAVNDEFAGDALVLSPHASIALLPPVSGGSAGAPSVSPCASI